MKYFYINNVKFNYTVEFNNSLMEEDQWKLNAPLIEYCETVGVNIPHYCYNKNLSISGNCRMCLVELEKAPKPVVSCAMSAKSCLNNSKVFTNSPLVKKARENILEFLLLNHPLDCPICDQGGECDLQDQSLFFGVSKKRFYNFKRTVTDKNIGPIVKTVMTRCIHCTRCVRFASEIAGVEDLGMFGRGLKSEIGNYVSKTFQSEVSGNIIDLCPVGALTSKPYPFLSRSWELKRVKSIDYTDSLSENLQVYLKNNKVVKILPSFNNFSNTTDWISDKTRFSFDGMFAPERAFSGLSILGSNTSTLTWKVLLEEIVYSLYFQDHLSKHSFIKNKVLIVFNGNSSLEVLNILLLLSKKYSFIKLVKSETSVINNDLESNFLLNSKSFINTKINKTNICLLIGVNTRYESSSLNLQLRKRYLKGDFNIFSIGAEIDLTFPVKTLGFNVSTLKSIIEGNNVFCQELLKFHNSPLIMTNTEFYNKKNSIELFNLLNLLKLKLNNYYLKWDNLSVLSSSINCAGTNYINKFNSISEYDFKNVSGLYFLNSLDNNLNLKKIINIKLLNYFKTSSVNKNYKFCIEHSNGIISNSTTNLIKNLNIFNYLNLPNNVFFESTGVYLNTKGVFKKSMKIIPSISKQTKDDWEIIRKIFSCLKNIDYLSNVKTNHKIYFNNNSKKMFDKYTEFLYLPSNFLNTKFELKSSANPSIFLIQKYKSKKNKLFLNVIKFWLNDFYINGKDSYSKYSITMIKCSMTLRKEKTNFVYSII